MSTPITWCTLQGVLVCVVYVGSVVKFICTCRNSASMWHCVIPQGFQSPQSNGTMTARTLATLWSTTSWRINRVDARFPSLLYFRKTQECSPATPRTGLESPRRPQSCSWDVSCKYSNARTLSMITSCCCRIDWMLHREWVYLSRLLAFNFFISWHHVSISLGRVACDYSIGVNEHERWNIWAIRCKVLQFTL